MYKKVILPTTFISILFSGCFTTTPSLTNNLTASLEQKRTFHTNTSNMLTTLSSKSTQEDRNEYMDEFILKSDMQCQQYLSGNKNVEPLDDATNQLYMGIFDTVSLLFGIKGITDSAKAVYNSSVDSNIESKKAYEDALSPEVLYGVKVTRNRFATQMNRKKNLSTKTYSIEKLHEDMKRYDKQCSKEYGLMEINRALKAMQQNINQTPLSTKIQAQTIKDKVTDVTKKVETKKKTEKRKKHGHR